jgi:hypothetical protein
MKFVINGMESLITMLNFFIVLSFLFSTRCNQKMQLLQIANAASFVSKDTTIPLLKDTVTPIKDTINLSNDTVHSVENVLDSVAYYQRCLALSNGDKAGKWPVKTVYPKAGAILPFKRVVAYYGNFYSKKMGILGELPENEMLDKLKTEITKWEQADSTTPVQPALQYIAATAQESAGKDDKHRLHMPFKEIDKAITMAKKIDAIVILDIQVGKSTVQNEIPLLEKYLVMPNVHLAIDPEFSMKNGATPGSEIGTYDAADINYVSNYLASLVQKFNLPPKIFVVHRFTKKMVTSYKSIKILPEVQFVMDMDGWGTPATKKNTYRQFVYLEPVQFTGIKIFYKNDTRRVGEKQVMQPEDVLKLAPKPIYIQYQ